jgi:hypothetical protein
MWQTVLVGVKTLFEGWIGLKKAKIETEAASLARAAQNETDWDNEALRQAQYSWKDEFITLIWYFPLIVFWFDPKKAQEWITFVGNVPGWYQAGMFGILAASFGLRWAFKNKAMSIVKGNE